MHYLFTRNTHIKEGFFLDVFWGSHGRSARNDGLYLGQFDNPFTVSVLPRLVVSQLFEEKKSDEKKDGENKFAFSQFLISSVSDLSIFNMSHIPGVWSCPAQTSVASKVSAKPLS